MARIKMYPADLDHIPCLFCGAQTFPDGSSPRSELVERAGTRSLDTSRRGRRSPGGTKRRPGSRPIP